MSAPGLEVLFSSVSSQLKGPSDALICALHWNIIHKGFKCIGVGEQSSASDKKTEVLPSGWNRDPNSYSLRYQQKDNNENYMLKVIQVDGSLLVHIMRTRDEKIASASLKISDYITDNLEEFDSAYKDLEKLNQRFDKEVFEKVVSSSESSGSSEQSTSQSSRRRPQRSDDPEFSSPLIEPGWGIGRGQRHWVEGQNPFSVGRGDLDPFGGGGGMFMDPARSMGPRFNPYPGSRFPSGFPPGAVPPGARFDPVGPPGTRADPDPDHEKPPDYDDMFM